MQRNAKDTFESWLVGELLLVALLGSATALFLTNPALRNTYDLPEGRLVLDTAVVLAASIVAILAGVRFSVEGRVLDLLLAAGFFVAGVGTLAFSVAPRARRLGSGRARGLGGDRCARCSRRR